MSAFGVLDAEVINYEDKHDRPPFMTPKAGGSCTLEVSVHFQALGEQVIGQFSGLFEAIDAFCDFKVDVAIVCKVVEAIFLNEFFGNISEFYSGVFWSVQRGAQVKVRDVKRSKSCGGRGEYAVYEKFDGL